MTGTRDLQSDMLAMREAEVVSLRAALKEAEAKIVELGEVIQDLSQS